MTDTPPFSFDADSLPILAAALERLQARFSDLPAVGGAEGTAAASATTGADISGVLLEVAERLQDNYPYFHPLYAGQMLKPPHPVARLAYALALWINPNNHALDGGRASSLMEKEAVAELARMVGWDAHLGHLTGGGTMANLEALWVAGQRSPGVVLASEQAHYTHHRISAVLGLPFEAVPVDRRGRMEMTALRGRLEAGGVGTVVATLGTTAVGSIDPLPEILALQARHGFRLHVDAAYGGYFGLVDNLEPEARAAYDRLRETDSVVIDPHKHGLQPYGCGCVLFRDPTVGALYRHDSPYTYFSSAELHLGEISLECSRPGAAAVALWATQRLLPTRPGGEFARGLAAGRQAALALHAGLVADPRVLTPFEPELDIVVWMPRASTLAEASRRARDIFAEAARCDLHLALAELPAAFFDLAGAGIAADRPTVTALRSVLMKPEHLAWIETIRQKIARATETILSRPHP